MEMVEPQLAKIDHVEYVLKKSGIDGITQKVVLMEYFPDYFIFCSPKIRKKEMELRKEAERFRSILPPF
ncbi:MAG: hypothetical protein JRN10_00755 [Nitrososphaerota archaeon]|jgi:hypothetical protein|nr:hypothetical protein [Nitrososphaerota archaeon]MDG6929766.1 hypothetical protein [Nitrososphaerota archaeon]